MVLVPPSPASGEARVGSSVQSAHKASTAPRPGVEAGMVTIEPLAAAPGVQQTDMSVSMDARLVDGQDDTV